MRGILSCFPRGPPQLKYRLFYLFFVFICYFRGQWLSQYLPNSWTLCLHQKLVLLWKTKGQYRFSNPSQRCFPGKATVRKVPAGSGAPALCSYIVLVLCCLFGLSFGNAPGHPSKCEGKEPNMKSRELYNFATRCPSTRQNQHSMRLFKWPFVWDVARGMPWCASRSFRFHTRVILRHAPIHPHSHVWQCL